jgi:carbonyl reductase 1
LQASSLDLHATSRSGDDFGLKHKHDRQRITYHSLDIHDSQSIEALGKSIGQVDIVINNAGVNVGNDTSLEGAQKTIDTNYRESLRMCQTFLPQLRPQGRIVNLSSTGSSLRIYSSEIQQRFRSARGLGEVEALADEYMATVDASGSGKSGWPPIRQSYSVSKACMNAFTAILAKENPDYSINCCCPGWVATDMGSIMGTPPKTPEEGARVPIHLAFDDLEGVTGRYWANDSISGKGDGKVQEW